MKYKTKEERILRTIVINYMVESRDASSSYLDRVNSVDKKWFNSDVELVDFCELLKSTEKVENPKIWAKAVDSMKNDIDYYED